MTARALALAVAVTCTAVLGGCGSGGRDDAAPAPPAPSAAERTMLEARLGGLVRLSPAALGYTVRWGAPRAGTRALADTAKREVWLFPRAGDAPHRVAHDLAHELGHAYDHGRMTEASRRDFLVRRGRPDAAWWPSLKDRHAYDSGAEDFAEVFALCHAASPEFRARLAPRPEVPCSLLPADAASGLTRRTS